MGNSKKGSRTAGQTPFIDHIDSSQMYFMCFPRFSKFLIAQINLEYLKILETKRYGFQFLLFDFLAVWILKLS